MAKIFLPRIFVRYRLINLGGFSEKDEMESNWQRGIRRKGLTRITIGLNEMGYYERALTNWQIGVLRIGRQVKTILKPLNSIIIFIKMHTHTSRDAANANEENVNLLLVG